MKYLRLFLSTVFVFSVHNMAAAATEEFKVALMGDTGANQSFARVLELALAENVDMIMINGDLGYGRRSAKWKERVLSVVNPSQVLIIGSLGNHDVERNQAQGYIDVLQSFRSPENKLTELCTGKPNMAKSSDVTAVNEVCNFGNVTVVASAIGQGGLGYPDSYYESELEQKLNAAPKKNWKLVGYHYTLSSMNPGLKGTQATHKFFDIIRKHGAVGAQGHTHTAMASCPIVSPFRSGEPVLCHPDFYDLEKRFIAPGVGLYVDSSISGKDIRRRGRCARGNESGCGHMVDLISHEGYTRVDGIKNTGANKDGALFFTFNVGGHSEKAHAYFKNVEGQTVFQFNLDR